MYIRAPPSYSVKICLILRCTISDAYSLRKSSEKSGWNSTHDIQELVANKKEYRCISDFSENRKPHSAY